MNKVEENLKGHLDELSKFVSTYVVKDPKVTEENEDAYFYGHRKSHKDLVNFLT
jgi:hypothetical protein